MGALTTTEGTAIGRWAGPIMADSNPCGQTRLVPVEAASSVVAEVDRALAGTASAGDGTKLLRRLMAGFPQNIRDAEGYVDVMQDEVIRWPVSVVAAAIAALAREAGRKWPPTRGELVGACEAERGRLLAIRYRAQWHLDERVRRKEAADLEARIAADRADPEMQAKIEALVASLKPGVTA